MTWLFDVSITFEVVVVVSAVVVVDVVVVDVVVVDVVVVSFGRNKYKKSNLTSQKYFLLGKTLKVKLIEFGGQFGILIFKL